MLGVHLPTPSFNGSLVDGASFTDSGVEVMLLPSLCGTNKTARAPLSALPLNIAVRRLTPAPRVSRAVVLVDRLVASPRSVCSDVGCWGKEE